MTWATTNTIAGKIAGEALAKHRRVRLNSSDQAVYADADDEAIGVVEDAVASGSHCSIRYGNVEGSLLVELTGSCSLNDRLYGADDGKVSTTKTGKAVYTARQAGSSGEIIEVLPIVEEPGLIYAAVADSTDVENTVTETTFSTGSKTIDGAQLKAGDVIEVLAQGVVTDNNSTDTLTVKLYLGTEEIVTTGAVDSADGDIFYIHAFITVRTLGASGTIQACGVVANGVPGTVTAKPFRKAQATEDISGDVAIAVKATWSVAHADNECNLESMFVKIHRQ